MLWLSTSHRLGYTETIVIKHIINSTMDERAAETSPITWLQYLEAMQVPVWVERSNLPAFMGCIEQSGESMAEAPSTKPVHSQVAEPEITGEEKSQPVPERVPTDATTEDNLTGETTSPWYFKLVNWRQLKEDNAQGKPVKLIVVCRSSTEQPSASFAGKSGPGWFMSDYLKALQACMQPQIHLDIQLAHLSATTINDDRVSVDAHLKTQQPDFIWVMADQAAAQLFSGAEIAQLRQQVLSFVGSDVPCMLSYHPYTLISEPKLKRLVMQDFATLKQNLLAL